jgi:hypothetical protein
LAQRPKKCLLATHGRLRTIVASKLILDWSPERLILHSPFAEQCFRPRYSRHRFAPAGATSIDVTKPGIDKAYGVRKLRDILGISLKEMIFIGDALFPGGNDYPAEEAGVVAIPVRGPEDTKRVIEAIIACLKDDLFARRICRPTRFRLCRQGMSSDFDSTLSKTTALQTLELVILADAAESKLAVN